MPVPSIWVGCFILFDYWIWFGENLNLALTLSLNTCRFYKNIWIFAALARITKSDGTGLAVLFSAKSAEPLSDRMCTPGLPGSPGTWRSAVCQALSHSPGFLQSEKKVKHNSNFYLYQRQEKAGSPRGLRVPMQTGKILLLSEWRDPACVQGGENQRLKSTRSESGFPSLSLLPLHTAGLTAFGFLISTGMLRPLKAETAGLIFLLTVAF